MKKITGLLFFLALTVCQANAVKNSEFAVDSVSGKMKNWSTIQSGIKPGRMGCTFQSGTAILTLEQGEKMVILIQRNIQLTPGAQYRFSFEAKTAQGIKFSSYFEWVLKNGKFGSSRTKQSIGTGEWKSYSFEFRAPAKGTEYKAKPYLAFALKTPCRLEIRKPVLTEVSSYAHIPDSGFDDPKSNSWNLTKNSRFLASGGHFTPGVLCLEGKGASASMKLLLAAGKNYKISYYVVGRNNLESTNGFSDYRCVMELNGKTVQGTNQNQDCFLNVWQGRSQIVRVPEGQDGVLTLTVRSLSAGEVLFDDFRIKEVSLKAEKAVKIVLDSPAYRNMIFSTDPVSEIRGKVLAANGIKNLSVSFCGKVIKTEPGKEFVFPANELKIGKYPLVAEWSAANGKKLTETITVEKLPPAKNEVVFNSRKQFLVNGKPFFSIGTKMLFVPASPVANYYMRRTGQSINIVLKDTKNLKEVLDQCHQAGLKVQLTLRGVEVFRRAGNMENFKKAWKKVLDRVEPLKQHPALLYYYPFDEPLWNGASLEFMEYVYNSLKEMDPYHPVLNEEAPRGTPDDWRSYAGYGDMFGIDIYPVPAEVAHSGIPEKGPRAVGAYAKLASETVDGRKPLYLTLQAFDWGNFAKKRKPFHRYPTREEFRFMNFDALLHGITATGYYRFNNNNVEAEKYMFQEINLFSRFVSVTLEGKEISQKMDSSAGVLTRTWEYKGNLYAVLLNRDDKSGYAELPADHVWNRVEFEGSVPVRETKIVLPKLSCRIFSTAKELPLGNTIPADDKMEKLLDVYFTRICSRPNLLRPSANWIWSNDDKQNLCRAVRTFNISKSVKKAVLRMTADDEFTCSLDGEEVLSGNDWKLLPVCNLTEKLKKGSHILAVQTLNRGGPCGFIGDLVIEYEDGTKEVIVTDSSWLASSGSADPDWKTKGLDKAVPAKVLAPLGKGPWRL